MPSSVFSAQTTVDVTLVTTAETIAIQSPPVVTPRPGCKVIITFWARVTTGTGTTSLNFLVRRGSLITDPIVGDNNPESVEASAGGTEAHEVVVEETPGELAGQVYTCTVTQTAATGNGAVVQATVNVEVFS